MTTDPANTPSVAEIAARVEALELIERIKRERLVFKPNTEERYVHGQSLIIGAEERLRDGIGELDALRFLLDALRESRAQVAALTARAAAVEEIAKRDYSDFPQKGYASANPYYLQLCDLGFGNGVHVVQKDVLTALGITDTVEDYLARKRQQAAAPADAASTTPDERAGEGEGE